MRAVFACVLGLAWAATQAAPAAPAAQALAAARASTREMSCAVVYLPERRTWHRRVVIRWEGERVLGLQVDGLQPYSFVVQGVVLATALDNERVLLDLSSMEWASDFRGLASGRGRCEWQD